NPFILNNVNDPPFIALLAPGAEVVPRGDIPVRWRAWDADGDPITIDVEYRRGTEPWRPLASGLANTGSYLWRAAGLAPANDYALRVVARDSKGALGSDAVRGISIVNNRPPEVTVLWPTEHTSVTTEAILLWRAVDPDGDALTIDLWYSDDAGQTWLPLAEGLPNTGYYVWQVAFLPLGSQYRVRLVARDRYFQSIDDSDATFAIGRNPPPRLALLEPGPGEAVHGLRLIRWSTLNPNASQLGIVPQIRPKGATAWEALSDVLPDDGFFLWDTTRYAEGDYELRLIARDAVGLRAASAPSEVRVMNHTNHPPHVELISPLGGEHWSGLRRISWRAWDPDGDPITATVQLSADDGYTWQTLARTDARHGLYVWDTRTAPPARQYLLAVAVDDGQATAKALTPGVFYLQSGRSHPPHLLVTSPDPAGQLTRNNLVTWLAEDLDGEDLSVDLLLSRDEGRTWEGIVRRMANVGEFILDRRWLSGSAQRLRLLVSDGIRRTYVDMPLRLSGDGERGGIEILSPLGGETWSGEQAIRWRIGASAMRTAPIVLELSGDGGQTWLTVHRGIGADTFLWDTTQVPNGTYLLRATIQNGKQTWTATGGPFDIRNAGRNLPSVSVLEPREGDIWSGTRVIRWYARDPDGDPLSVNLAYSIDDGQSWRPLGYAPIDTGNYVWDTSTAPNCSRVWVRVTVSDGRFIAQATSIGPFAIRNGHAPTVRLISPKGGEQWTGIGEIRWEAIYESTRTPQVILQYSLDRGRTWQPLAENLPPAGIYRWNSALVPEESRVLLRAMATDGLEGGVDMLLQPITVRGNASPVSLPFYLR
ncbi:MAG: hypothetical protein H5T69_16150, partial [Chloroflexi bacterium]|nr:hypothetical protein [Chloroflexota bacterium]